MASECTQISYVCVCAYEIFFSRNHCYFFNSPANIQLCTFGFEFSSASHSIFFSSNFFLPFRSSCTWLQSLIENLKYIYWRRKFIGDDPFVYHHIPNALHTFMYQLFEFIRRKNLRSSFVRLHCFLHKVWHTISFITFFSSPLLFLSACISSFGKLLDHRISFITDVTLIILYICTKNKIGLY